MTGLKPRCSADGRSLRTNFAHAATEFAPEEIAQRNSIRIADGCGDTLNVIAGSPKQMHSALNAQILEVREGTLAEHLINATRQRSLARPDGARGVIK